MFSYVPISGFWDVFPSGVRFDVSTYRSSDRAIHTASSPLMVWWGIAKRTEYILELRPLHDTDVAIDDRNSHDESTILLSQTQIH